jgi:hypothetical protein
VGDEPWHFDPGAEELPEGLGLLGEQAWQHQLQKS